MLKKALPRMLALGLATTPFFLAAGFGQDSQENAPEAQLSEPEQACMACHSREAQAGPVVNVQALKSSPHAPFSCTDCHLSVTDAPHTPEMLKEKAACANCHTEQQAALAKSTHAKQDYVTGDHPTCAFCHGGGDNHAITAGSKWTREQKIEVCTRCHAQTERMKRYHVDPDAVTSYHDSFHGKALLRFGNLRTAICTDCHGHHDVLAPTNPASPTHESNVAKTCGRAGCHPRANLNFALSGANHLRLKVKDEPVLLGVLWFFRFLIFGTIAFMVLSITLDLIKVVYRSKEPPRCGRPAGVLISFSYLSLVTTIVLAALEARGVAWAAAATVGLIVLALIANFLWRPKPPPAANHRTYLRMNLNVRLQHLLLLLSVFTLTATGLPLRFADSKEVARQLNLFGGLEASRLLHRGAAIGLIVVALWHIGYLLARGWRHGFALRNWRMLPNRKDVADFIAVTKTYFGISNEEPKFDHYTFRSKIDYLAEYWGVPIMVLTGLVLWFPIYFSTWLPENAWALAFIAHGYEATLAFLAVICWHLYNVLFHPNIFPFNPLCITGRLTRAEMEREHGYELQRIEAAEAANTKGGP